MAETTSPGWQVGYGYLSGQLLTQYRDSTTYFFQHDHLGSTRVMTALNQNVYDSMDYLPYGEQIAGATGSSHKFTGKERDSETGLDYFGARYYGSALSRFTSPDPGKLELKHLLNPQKWDKYAYVLNNPLRYIDPDGQKEVEIRFDAFIPYANVGGFRGDNRGFSADNHASARVSVRLTIETDPGKNNGNPLVHRATVNVGQTHSNITGNDKTSTGPKYPQVTVTRDKDGNTNVNIQENMRNPFVELGSGIKSDVNVSINQGATQANISGTISGAPSFETNFSVEGGPNQNVPLQSAPDGSTDITRSINFGIGLQETKEINKTVPLQQPDKNKDEKQ